jgi:hypothetical protein
MLLTAIFSSLHGFIIAMRCWHLLSSRDAMPSLILSPMLIILLVALAHPHIILAHNVERCLQLLHRLPLRFVNLSHFSLKLQSSFLLLHLLIQQLSLHECSLVAGDARVEDLFVQ